MGEDLECLCQIMRTVGPRLDHEKAKVQPSPRTLLKVTIRIQQWKRGLTELKHQFHVFQVFYYF